MAFRILRSKVIIWTNAGPSLIGHLETNLNQYTTISIQKNYFENVVWKMLTIRLGLGVLYDNVIKWKHFPRYLPFVWGIVRSPVNSPHKGQWCGALMVSLICARKAGVWRRHRAHYDITVMRWICLFIFTAPHWRLTILVIRNPEWSILTMINLWHGWSNIQILNLHSHKKNEI